MNRPPIPFPEAFKPRYWLLWLVFGLLRLINLLPFGWQSTIGRWLGKIMYLLAAKRRRIAAINLALCFPELTEQQRMNLLKRNFEHQGMQLLETGISWWGSARWINRLGRITGFEHLQTALAKGKGVILLTGHMTSLDLGGQILAEALAHTDTPLFVMYKRSRNPLIEALMLRGRLRFASHVFKRQDLRSFLKGLAGNHPVWYAPDQDFGLKQGVFADFFGIPTATLTATAKFAAKSGAQVVPYFPIRLPGNKGFEIRIFPALEDFPVGDDVADARTTNAVLEQMVRKFPEQYMWLHRRFKTRPAGMPTVY